MATISKSNLAKVFAVNLLVLLCLVIGKAPAARAGVGVSISVSGNEGWIPVYASASFSPCVNHNNDYGCLAVYDNNTYLGGKCGYGSASFSTKVNGAYLSQGRHDFTAVACDHDNQCAGDSKSITIDNTPELTVNFKEDPNDKGGVVIDGTLDFKDNPEGNEGYLLIEVKAPSGWSGYRYRWYDSSEPISWTYADVWDAPFSPGTAEQGTYNFTFKAVAVNNATNTITKTFEIKPPELDATVNNDGNKVNISGTVDFKNNAGGNEGYVLIEVKAPSGWSGYRYRWYNSSEPISWTYADIWDGPFNPGTAEAGTYEFTFKAISKGGATTVVTKTTKIEPPELEATVNNDGNKVDISGTVDFKDNAGGNEGYVLIEVKAPSGWSGYRYKWYDNSEKLSWTYAEIWDEPFNPGTAEAGTYEFTFKAISKGGATTVVTKTTKIEPPELEATVNNDGNKVDISGTVDFKDNAGGNEGYVLIEVKAPSGWSGYRYRWYDNSEKLSWTYAEIWGGPFNPGAAEAGTYEFTFKAISKGGATTVVTKTTKIEPPELTASVSRDEDKEEVDISGTVDFKDNAGGNEGYVLIEVKAPSGWSGYRYRWYDNSEKLSWTYAEIWGGPFSGCTAQQGKYEFTFKAVSAGGATTTITKELEIDNAPDVSVDSLTPFDDGTFDIVGKVSFKTCDNKSDGTLTLASKLPGSSGSFGTIGTKSYDGQNITWHLSDFTGKRLSGATYGATGIVLRATATAANGASKVAEKEFKCVSDADKDKALDCEEECPKDPNKTKAGECGCGVADIVSITPEKDKLPQGETMRVDSETENPSGAPLTWRISRVGDSTASASIAPSEDGTFAIIYNASGLGKMKIEASNATCTKDHEIEIGCSQCQGDSGQCDQSGGGEVKQGSILVTINSGRTFEGRTAGSLILHTDTAAPANATPQFLKFNTPNRDSEVIRKDNVLRQIVAPEAFIDIVTDNEFSYSINFYLRKELGEKTDGLYGTVSGAFPHTVWRIENPDASLTSYNRLRVSRQTGADVKIYDYEWDEANQTWTLAKGGGLQILGKKVQAVSDGKIIAESIVNESGAIASKTISVYHTYPWGNELVQKVIDPDSAALTETRSYYDVAGEPGYGYLKTIIMPDGSWVRYAYDAQGRKMVEISSWLDAAFDSPAAASRAVYYDYTIQNQTDSNALEDKVRPRLVTETILGQVVKKTFHVYQVDSATKERTEIVKQAGIPGAGYDDAANLTTTTVFYPVALGTAQSGKVKTRIRPDGLLDAYSYEYGQYVPSGVPGQPGVFTPGAGKALRSMVVHGSVAHPQGIAGKTTREMIIADEFGRQLFNETQVFTGSGYERIGYEVSTYDERGRLTGFYYSDGSRSETESNCCNKIKEVDRSGVTTRYVAYDALGRLTTKVKDESALIGAVSTTFTYDAAGRQLSQTDSGGSLSLTSRSEYDGAGRQSRNVDPRGLATEYRYSADGRTDTVIKPGGATELTERFIDGKTKSVTGTAGPAMYYSYGVNADGTQWTLAHTGAADSPVWEKTTVDMFGRTVKSEHPGAQGDEAVLSFYDNQGRVTKVITPARAATLYQYDELGNRLATALDVDGNGQIDPAGSDRINATDSTYVRIGEDWWLETAKKVYTPDSGGAPVTVTTSRSRLTGLGGEGLTSEDVIVDIHGNQTVERTYVDRAAKQITTVTDYSDATNDEHVRNENGLAISELDKTGVEYFFSYDALGRRIGVTEPRTGTTTTHYDANGRVDYVEDPLGARTIYSYDPTTGRKIAETNAKDRITRFEYNTQGQLVHVWGAAPYPVEYRYDDFGRKIEMRTYRGGTGWDAPVWPSDATGPADVTTWNYLPGSNLLESKVYADGNVVTYTYKTGGLLRSRTWARENNGEPQTTLYDYDPATGELRQIDYSDATPDILFEYDRMGRKKEVRDAVGAHTFKYNDKLQLATETMSGLYERVITRAYTQSGMLGRDAGFSLGEKYGVTYGYEDATGRFNSVSWQAGGSAQAAEYKYLANSSLLHDLTIGKRQTIYGYEEKRDLLATVQNNFNGEPVSQYGYRYDAIGQRDSVVNSGNAFPVSGIGFNLYKYNTRNELTESSRYQGADLANTSKPLAEQYRLYEYDSIGNRTQAMENINYFNYVTNNLNQYTTVNAPEPQVPGYDADGDMTNFDGKVYSFNGENRLVAVAPENPADGGQKLEFLYDYMGRRVQKTVYTQQNGEYRQTANTKFVYDGWNLIEEISSTPSKASVFYVWGLDLSGSLQGAGGVGGLLAAMRDFSDYDLDHDGDVDGVDLQLFAASQGATGSVADFATLFGGISQPHLYLYDANGNVGQVIDAGTGEIKARYEYNPFGGVLIAAGQYDRMNPFRFSTKYHDDETGLVYYGYRYYVAELGRWLNRDPEEESGGINLFGFIANNPLNKYDILGLKCSEPERNNNARAIVRCDCGDTINDLDSVVKFDIREYKKWLRADDGMALPDSASTPFDKKRIFTIPNTVFHVLGILKWFEYPFSDIFYEMMAHQKEIWEKAGFSVVTNERTNIDEMISYLKNANIHSFSYWGHGPGLEFSTSSDEASLYPYDASTYLHHGLAELRHYGCESAVQTSWEGLVSKKGTFTGTTRKVGPNEDKENFILKNLIRKSGTYRPRP